MASRRVGIWLIGALGNVGASVALGIAALKRGLCDRTGLVTALSEFAGVDLDEPAEFVVGGHDIRNGDLATTAASVGGIRPAYAGELINTCRPDLEAWSKDIRPGCLLNCDPAALNLANRADFSRNEPVVAGIERLQSDLRSFARRHQLDQVVVINVASTEPPAAERVAQLDMADIQRAIKSNDASALPTSAWCAYAAIDVGFPYVNFTASTGADIPAIVEHAKEKRVPLAGSDAKTGETLVKTALAPMFRNRNLKVLSWVGHNILGNRDGKVLSQPDNRASKLRSKDQVLASLLGYLPQTLTTIEQIESVDDWKTAWDHVQFQGFLGVPMTMQFTWQGCDSALAAPLVLDLARLMLAAQRHSRSGPVDELAVFFKNPMGTAEHDLSRQFGRLADFARMLAVI
jgi:myo-inositol-1-phosphate synthase